ncbi:MAG: amino acid ABC transporter permease [Bacillota bacterium]
MSASTEFRPGQPPEPVMPPVTELGVVGWLKKNLFNSWYNTLLTLATLWLLYKLGGGLLSWALFKANWGVVGKNLQVLMVGGYPAEHLWRVWLVVAIAAFWSGVTWGGWARMNRMSAIGLGVALLLLQLLPISTASRIWVAASVLLIPAGLVAGTFLARWRCWVIFLWGPVFVGTLLVLGGAAWTGLPLVETSRWNGLMLTILLAVTGIVACFPIGVLLALGRQSSLPAIRWVSIGYIEVIRGVPLVTVLFMGSLVIPLFLPEGIRIQDVIRAFIGLTLFEAAYMAENIRGGLQALSKGQMEAAQALGLRGWQSILLIQLPQALRAVIPAMVGQFIALLKDTSLISIIGLAEFTFIAKAVLRHPENIRFHFEIYLFVAFVYWLLCYSLAVASRRLEKRLGVGER